MSLILIILILLLIVFYNWSRRKLYLLANKLNGPIAFPIIGNAPLFTGDTNDLFKLLKTLAEKYGNPMRIWFGPELFVYFSQPKHLEKILSSSKLAYKHRVYKIIQIYIGDGLVSNLGGDKYRKHRRLIQPLISVNFVAENINNYQRHLNKLLNHMELCQNKGTFDAFHLIHSCFADIIGESVLGININAQDGDNKEFITTSYTLYKKGYERLTKPWLHPDCVYNLTMKKREQDEVTAITTNFIRKAIGLSRKRIEANENQGNDTTPIIDKIGQIIRDTPDIISEEDFVYHMFTLYLASEDTLSLISSLLCVCLGMYPEYQQKAVEEIRTVIGENQTDIKYEDLQKLEYLDMCIRDILRLIPIAPLILRQPIEDFPLDDMVIPKGCGILVSIFDVHRNPEFWENPNHFHPDHFLPEVHKKRHPYAYIPFSAGGRSCVGKVLANLGLKLFMVNILQKFEIEADGKFPDIVLKADITVRSESGYKIRLKRRKWN